MPLAARYADVLPDDAPFIRWWTPERRSNPDMAPRVKPCGLQGGPLRAERGGNPRVTLDGPVTPPYSPATYFGGERRGVPIGLPGISPRPGLIPVLRGWLALTGTVDSRNRVLVRTAYGIYPARNRWFRMRVFFVRRHECRIRGLCAAWIGIRFPGDGDDSKGEGLSCRRSVS